MLLSPFVTLSPSILSSQSENLVGNPVFYQLYSFRQVRACMSATASQVMTLAAHDFSSRKPDRIDMLQSRISTCPCRLNQHLHAVNCNQLQVAVGLCGFLTVQTDQQICMTYQVSGFRSVYVCDKSATCARKSSTNCDFQAFDGQCRAAGCLQANLSMLFYSPAPLLKKADSTCLCDMKNQICLRLFRIFAIRRKSQLIA